MALPCPRRETAEMVLSMTTAGTAPDLPPFMCEDQNRHGVSKE